MSNLLQLKFFVNERLSAAALEIFGAVEKTVNEYCEEMCFAKEENERLQQLLMDMEIKHRTELQQLSAPDPLRHPAIPRRRQTEMNQLAAPQYPEIKQEPEVLLINQWDEKAQGNQQQTQGTTRTHRTQGSQRTQGQKSDIENPSATPARMEKDCLVTVVKKETSDLCDQYQTTDSRVEVSLPGPIERKLNNKTFELSEPDSDCMPHCVVVPNCPSGLSSENGENSGLIPEFNSMKSMKKQNGLPVDSRELSEMELIVEVHPENKSPFPVPDYSFPSQSPTSQNPSGTLPYQGLECGNDLNDTSHLFVHMSSHIEDRLPQHQEYGGHFEPTHSQAVYIKHHSTEKPFHCQRCGKQFSQKRYLLTHLKTHARVRPHHCKECGKGFISTRDVRVHMRIHTGEKPFKCKECSKCFNTASGLRVHMRFHTGEKPFWCQDCGRTFRQKPHLVAHMRTHRE